MDGGHGCSWLVFIWAAPVHLDSLVAVKIVGQMVCGPGEADRYLRDSLDELKRLCDDAVVVTCNATEKEIKLIQRYGFWTYQDNREWGRYQPDIKTELLGRIARLKPDWVLALDADETLPTILPEVLEDIATGRVSTYFYIVNLWNDAKHYSKDLSFWNVRYYKLPGEADRQFLRQPVHCGSAPPVAWKQSAHDSYVPHIVLHTGLMLPSDRAKKAERYHVYDPNAKYKGREYYDALVAGGSGSEYNQSTVINQLIDYCKKL